MTAPQTVADVPIVATLSGLDAVLQAMEARSDFGSRVILIQNDEHDWRDDYLAGLTMIDGNRQRHGFEPNDLLCWPRKDDVTHTFSPAPVSKRRARRLRAALAAATSARQGETK